MGNSPFITLSFSYSLFLRNYIVSSFSAMIMYTFLFPSIYSRPKNYRRKSILIENIIDTLAVWRRTAPVYPSESIDVFVLTKANFVSSNLQNICLDLFFYFQVLLFTCQWEEQLIGLAAEVVNTSNVFIAD